MGPRRVSPHAVPPRRRLLELSSPSQPSSDRDLCPLRGRAGSCRPDGRARGIVCTVDAQLGQGLSSRALNASYLARSCTGALQTLSSICRNDLQYVMLMSAEVQLPGRKETDMALQKQDGQRAEKFRLLTQSARGTPMGDLLRRFWQPVALSTEV